MRKLLPVLGVLTASYACDVKIDAQHVHFMDAHKSVYTYVIDSNDGSFGTHNPDSRCPLKIQYNKNQHF